MLYIKKTLKNSFAIRSSSTSRSDRLRRGRVSSSQWSRQTTAAIRIPSRPLPCKRGVSPRARGLFSDCRSAVTTHQVFGTGCCCRRRRRRCRCRTTLVSFVQLLRSLATVVSPRSVRLFPAGFVFSLPLPSSRQRVASRRDRALAMAFPSSSPVRQHQRDGQI